MRPSKREYYLQIAAAVAVRSTCLKHKYGAIIVKNDVIISTGYNGAPRGEENCCDLGGCYAAEMNALPRVAKVHGTQYGACVAVHAEQNAIIQAGPRARGAVMYLACLTPDRIVAPCNYCDRLIRNAGIKEVISD